MQTNLDGSLKFEASWFTSASVLLRTPRGFKFLLKFTPQTSIMPPATRKRAKKGDSQDSENRDSLVIAKLENSIDKINDIITNCAEATAVACKEGKIEQMTALLNSPGYLATIDLLRQCYITSNSETTRASSKTNEDEAYTVSNSRYDVLITSKKDSTLTPMQAYQHAIKVAKVQASDWHDTDAKTMRFEMMCIEHANTLDKTLREGTLFDGIKLADLVESSILISSAYSVKTIGISKDDHAKITWATGTEVELNTAMDTLIENNHFWFRQRQDIENVNIHSNNSDKFWVTIYTSKKAYDRFLTYPGNIRRVALDKDIRPVITYEQVRHDACYNCLEVCPGSNKCTKSAKCRFCGDNKHKSNECTKKRKPRCFRCRIPPTEKEIEDIKAELSQLEDIANPQNISPYKIHAERHHYNHDALSNKCPFIRERVNHVLALKRAAAKNESSA